MLLEVAFTLLCVYFGCENTSHETQKANLLRQAVVGAMAIVTKYPILSTYLIVVAAVSSLPLQSTTVSGTVLVVTVISIMTFLSTLEA